MKKKQNPDRKRLIEIWMEGYRGHGASTTAHKVAEYVAEDFDEAVEIFKSENPRADLHRVERADFQSQDDYTKRHSNYTLLGCNLFNNEADARQFFG